MEIAASDIAAALVTTGMPVNLRLFSLNGRLLEGAMTDVFVDEETASQFLPEPVRSDREGFMQTAVSRRDLKSNRVRLYAAVNSEPDLLRTGKAGYARIAVKQVFLGYYSAGSAGSFAPRFGCGPPESGYA